MNMQLKHRKLMQEKHPQEKNAAQNRRQFLGQMARRTGMAGLAAYSTLGLSSVGVSGIWVSRAQAATVNGMESRGDGRLVVLMLRGAVDGLSVVVPYTDPNYYAARSSIAIAKPGELDGALRLDAQFGLHPALNILMPYWQRGQLGFVHASGSHDLSRSHFDAQDYMESGTPGRKSTQDGWMNRLATVLAGNQTDANLRLQAVNLGPVMPRILTGPATVASLAQGNAAITRGVLDREPVAEAFARLYSGEDKLAKTVREATATRKEILNSLASDDPKADQGSLSLRGLATDTARLGQLMQRDARVRLAFVPVGGWDTHVNQGNGKGQLANRLQLLGEAIDSLVTGLGHRFQETTVVVMSEFGRTVRQNGNSGTDHGHGNVMWAFGPGVQGGKVHGVWPGLDTSALHEGRDLAVTTDFRQVMGDILVKDFRLSEKQLGIVFPNFSMGKRVGLIA
jgi:uncharacterized protein (DUF1501 family)